MAKKILFINQEITPYVPDNDLSLMGKSLPQVIQDLGHEIRTFMPKWGVINERRGQLHEVIRLSGMNLIIDDTDHPLIIKVATIVQTRVQVYFIDNEEYFSRRYMTRDEQGKDFADNGKRSIFFARGWMGAVIPLYIKTAYHDEPSFADTKVVTSLFTDDLTNPLSSNFKRCIEFRDAKASLLKKYKDDFDFQELAKLAIDYSDGVVAARPDTDPALLAYARENGKETLDYQGDDFGAAYEELYEKL